MRTFPDADPGTPDTRGPWRFLLWIAARHWRSLAADCVFNVLWVGGQALTPAVIGQAVSAGLVARNQAALVWWGLAVLGLGVVQAVSAMFVERFELVARVGGGYQTLQLVTRRACDLGATVGRRVSAGDLVTVGVSDISLIGRALQAGARGVGGAVGFVVVAALMLVSSWPVGLLVLIAVPVILLITTRLARALRTRQDQVRTRQRELADQAIDIVRGLRVLRGLGGEAIFASRFRDRSQQLRFTVVGQARATAMLGVATTFLPGLLLVGVVALSAELALARQLSAGQMVAFYAYAAFLVLPINRMTYAVSRAMQAHVAAASITRLLRMPPDIEPGLEVAAMPGAGALADPDSGLTVPAHGLTAIASTAGDAVALADRLGRYTDSGVTYDGWPLASLPLRGVRERILVATPDAHLFAGPLRRELDPAGRLDGSDAPLWAAIDAAAARDIIEALPDQLDTSVAAAGREFSGGQRQRLRLARALMADPELLILIDPTSAVDAHTESLMAAGIARLRQGRATAVFTTSILLLGQADHVALVIDGTLAAEGSHESLMADARYRSLVERGTRA
ncbi:MAG TPA: ABC transporter ATP-binding protein [Trebonia sp.]|nr:ABC transporter ATP-binding protein [Trebonia sp.]